MWSHTDTVRLLVGRDLHTSFIKVTFFYLKNGIEGNLNGPINPI